MNVLGYSVPPDLFESLCIPKKSCSFLSRSSNFYGSSNAILCVPYPLSLPCSLMYMPKLRLLPGPQQMPPWLALRVHIPAVEFSLKDKPREKSIQGLEGAWATWAKILKAGSRGGSWSMSEHPHLDPAGSLPGGESMNALEVQVQVECLDYLHMRPALCMPLCFCLQNNTWGVRQKA